MFSLITTSAIGNFTESANAARKGKTYNKSKNLPALQFEAIFERDDNTKIKDNFLNNDNIGIFENAITVFESNFDIKNEPGRLINGSQVGGELDTLGLSSSGFKANLSAVLNNDEITYQIYFGDANNYQNPESFLRFTPIKVSSDLRYDFVNDIKSILNDSIPGIYEINEVDKTFTKSGSGILGLAINSSIKFLSADESDDLNGGTGFGNGADDLEIKQIGSQTSTEVPEPTIVLGSLFVLGVGSRFLRKHETKTSNLKP
ncbi:hypothetical protein BC008_22115 [Mastigocoleus testarum BC008]|uniref:PEP-CTERM protein-sorting domain-containing protein n=2 Tax=Mastigocoleus TaxID=996924 RepID=A0A0V7ZMN6_9CYAN|nr:hypothetical protein BC008_22115 [Mastigocoleus testarum BC008]